MEQKENKEGSEQEEALLSEAVKKFREVLKPYVVAKEALIRKCDQKPPELNQQD